ncbi:MAG: hypothetical protein LBV33_04925 [Lachnospiraceae bacterium]|nr:hypothetical protein [Lachnospiraceae bacterium]
MLILLSTGCASLDYLLNHQNVPFDPGTDEYLSASTPVKAAPTDTLTITNPYPDLKVPTYITKIGTDYFIVDCYHNQIIYHDNLTDPITDWSVMTNDINRGHTIASDGIVYLIDDTENDRILIMEKQITADTPPHFIATAEFNNIGRRPHYIVYDQSTTTFYAWSSMTGEMYLFRRDPDNSSVYLTEIRTIPSLMDIYVRSFTIIGNDIYFVSGNSSIIRADLSTFHIIDEYPVSSELNGMVQLTLINDYFYLTISTDATGNQDYATLIRTNNLNTLIDGEFEDIYDHFIGGGTPYFITGFDGYWYLTEHRLPNHSIWRFQVTDNEINDVTPLY